MPSLVKIILDETTGAPADADEMRKIDDDLEAAYKKEDSLLMCSLSFEINSSAAPLEACYGADATKSAKLMFGTIQ